MKETLSLGAFEIAEKIRNKEFSPLEVINAHIEQIEKVNPALNAMVEDRFAEARSEAEKKTHELAQKSTSDLPPLFGVPFTVKEMLAYKGMRRTAGSIHKKDMRSDFNATVVQRLLDAGGIALCTTNVPELGFWFETDNPVYGRTNNPFDVSRTSGGSSGGEGALIGAGASPLGLGSDIGGSIRMPASFCGIYGHKPTNRIVPLTGHFPYSLADMEDLTGTTYPYTSVGPMCRKGRDLYPVMKILAGPDGIDRETRSDFSFKEKPTDPSKIKIFFCDDPRIHLCRRTEEDARQAVQNTARLFESYGASVQEFDPRFFSRAVKLWGTALKSTKDHTYAELLAPGENISFPKELWNVARKKPRYTIPSLSVAFLESFLAESIKPGNVLNELVEMRRQLNEILGEDGVLLFPAHPRVAPKHRAPWLSPFDFIQTGIFNALGNPVSAAPTGLNEEGLPLSVQIVGARDADHLTLACAGFIEDGFGPVTSPWQEE